MSKDKRRQYGTGSVYRRASDSRWIGAFQAGWLPSGGPRVLTVSAACPCPGECRGTGRCPGEVEVKKRLAKRQAALADDGGATAGGHLTVKAWCERWLPVHATKARPKYYATDASIVRKWIVPTLGNRRLDTLTPADVRKVSDAVRKAGRSTTTAKYAAGTLKRILDAAAADGYTVSRLAREVAPPGKATNDRAAIPLDDALKLLDAASRLPDGSRWVAALLQGMRQGECLGLTWECVDLERGTIDVSWQMQELPSKHGCLDDEGRPTCGRKTAGRCTRREFLTPDGYDARQLYGATHLVRPKSEHGWRVLPLVPWMTAALTAWKATAPTSAHGLVWPVVEHRNRKMIGRARTSDADRDAWYELQAAVGVCPTDNRATREPCRYLLHEARHTTATLLLEAGVDETVIIAIMGHSSIVTTRGYQHVSQALARRALDGVAERLGLTAA